jgi:hypothetical protein
MKVNLDELKHWMQHVYHYDLENTIMHAFFECNKKKVCGTFWLRRGTHLLDFRYDPFCRFEAYLDLIMIKSVSKRSNNWKIGKSVELVACSAQDYDITFKEYRGCLARKPDTPTPTVKSENRMVARWRLADQDGDNRLSLWVVLILLGRKPKTKYCNEVMHPILQYCREKWKLIGQSKERGESEL